MRTNAGEQTAEIGGCIVGLAGSCERVRFRGPALGADFRQAKANSGCRHINRNWNYFTGLILNVLLPTSSQALPHGVGSKCLTSCR